MLDLQRFLCGSAVLGLVLGVFAAPEDSLESGFHGPPDSAKPHTWWHWMNGNITKEGITADLEAMKQIGLGGATIVNVDCGIPAGKVPFMSPEWREDFKFAVSEANRLNLRLGVENCAGWSSSGGPWVSASNAMQRLTSSETRAEGPAVFDAVLPEPSAARGLYRDIAVLAFKAQSLPAAAASNKASAAGKLEIKHASYEAKGGGPSADVTARLIDLIKSGQRSIGANNDELGGDPAYGQVKQLRVEFVLDGKPGTIVADEGETLIVPVDEGQLAVARSNEKTWVDRTFVHPPSATAAAAGQIVPRDEIVDLTAKLGTDGRIKWEVPPGSWTILRLGYTPIGVENHPAPAEGLGLECDKLSQTALDEHWAGFMQKILDDAGPLAGPALHSSLIDSYEVGNQDWTPRFRAEFRERRGYDPLKFLPAFSRRIVDSPEITERFLWDVRRTVADLFAENYYGHFDDLCRQHGLESQIEPYDGPYESLQCGAPAGVVMGEFWTGSDGHPSVKLAASVAHIYGKSLVGAESFTAGEDNARWQNDPYALKALGDLMYCQGVNRCYFHRYAMQPWTNRWPGMTMGEFGINFERTQTWWKPGKAWIDYLSRCEFMLQQGRAVADAAYFAGESAPSEMRAGNPALPAGYDFDAVNADVLLHGAEVKNGRVTLASGASYGALILPPDDIDMTPPMMDCLRKLVREGAVVVGPRPDRSPSLADYPGCDAEVKKIADELWGKCDGVSVQENADGQGRIFWGKSLVDVFARQKLKPDFESQGDSASAHFAYAHRVAGAADIYFVSNQRREFESADCVFRVSDKLPELWHPDTGAIEPATVWSAQDGRTKVHLDFDPAGSVFVVFRRAAGRADHVVAANGSVATEPDAAPKLEIQQAVYAAIDGAGGMDVTARLSKLVRNGRLSVVAKNDNLGPDPALNHEKELRVDYTLDGKPAHARVAENDTLTIPSRLSSGGSPTWKITAANGSAQVKAWGNGRWKLQMASGKILGASAGDLPDPREITGAWDLSFPPGWGAPPSVTLDKLISWTEHTNAGVRFFSGTATYEKEIEISAERLGSGREVWLDLGAVKNFAEVSLNGQSFGVLWKPPFRVDVTSAAKPGTNKLVIKVTNLWPNRLIGDEQLPPDCEWDGSQLKQWPRWLLNNQPSPTGRLTFSTWRHVTKDSPLLESGLMGPVTLQTAELVPARYVSTSSTSDFFVAAVDARSGSGLHDDPTNGLGSWIWADKVADNQTCLLWKEFEVPSSTRVTQARLCMTVDNEFTVFLDGRELGHGDDWHELFVFDLTPLLVPGKHVLAVRAFNSFFFAGMILGLQVDLSDGSRREIKSDESWRVVPDGTSDWERMTEPAADWAAATVEAPFGGDPWWTKPVNVDFMPTLQPIKLLFWQTGWFQITLLSICGVVILISLRLMAQLAFQQKEQQLLQQERARIAREIHDDIGARMTQLVLLGEVVQNGLPGGSEMQVQIGHLCEEARGLLATMDEILWAVNPRRDTLRDFAAYVCKHAEEFLKHTKIQCIFEVDSGISAAACNLPLRRSLLMAIKETLNNAVKHSQATELRLQIKWQGQRLVVVVRDNGKGFDPASLKMERNGLLNMSQRMRELGGECIVASQPGQGCQVKFSIPLKHPRGHFWSWIWDVRQFSKKFNENRFAQANELAQNHDPTKC